MKLIAAVEGGGTTFTVAICNAKTAAIIHRTSVDSTGDPATTITRCALFLKPHRISALAIACFGPIGLNPNDETTYGRILSTSPKQSWRGVNVLTPLLEACDGCPHIIDTDVNAPAAMEFALSTTSSSSSDTSISSCAYVTVGTGVGVGLVVNGKTVKGWMHPEGGHIPVQPLPGDSFGGYSWGGASNHLPFDGKNTVESLACAVALTERYQQLVHGDALDRHNLKEYPNDSEIWDHAANALASLAASMILMLSIEKIVFGGGVMQRKRLLGDIRARTKVLLNGYLDIEDDLHGIIVVSKHGKDAGYVK